VKPAERAIERNIAEKKKERVPPLRRAAVEGIVPCANRWDVHAEG
jgi:hypothetical protein